MGGNILVIQLLASHGTKLNAADAVGGAELLAAAAKVCWDGNVVGATVFAGQVQQGGRSKLRCLSV
jgi:hypothetical protein